MQTTTIDPVAKQRRGLALVSPEKRREIASKGGRERARRGTGHVWTSEEAQRAGRKGGAKGRGLPRPRVKGVQP